MGRGLVLGAMGRAVGNVGATVSDMMVRDISDRQRQEARDRERDEDREFKAEQARLQREALVERQEARGGSRGGGGMSAPPLENVAGSLGMTAPELEAYDKAQKTGDFSGFKTAQREDDAGPSKYDPKEFDQARATYPPGVTDESIRAKFKQIAEIRTSMAMGKDNDDYQKGRSTSQDVALADGVIGGKISQGAAAGAVAAKKGKGAFDGDSNVTRNEFTGDTKTTAVGDSVIRENNAQAGAAGARSSGGGAAAKAPTVRSTKEDDKGNVIAVMSDGTTKDLGMKSAAFGVQVARLIAQHEKNTTDRSFKKLSEDEKKDWAATRLASGGSSTPATAPSRAPSAMPSSGVTKGGSKYSIVK